MISKIDQLINQLDPVKKLCECCGEFDFVRNFNSVSLSFSDLNFELCINCYVKYNYFFVQHINFLVEYNDRFLMLNFNDFTISDLQKLIIHYYSDFKMYVQHKEMLMDLEIQKKRLSCDSMFPIYTDLV